MSADPLIVKCPDCLAPPQTACRVDNPQLAEFGHAGRRDRARVAAAARGTCALCGQEMVQLSDPVETFHPEGLPTPCPPQPSTDPYDFPGWQRWLAAGNVPGRPGDQHFIPPEESHADDSDQAAPSEPA